jgi:hypothetical protein
MVEADLEAVGITHGNGPTNDVATLRKEMRHLAPQG